MTARQRRTITIVFTVVVVAFVTGFVVTTMVSWLYLGGSPSHTWLGIKRIFGG